MGKSQQTDILVVGGGPAGVAAAVTAARRGLRVVLVEGRSFLGGTPVAGFQNQLCGYYGNDPERPFRVLNHGFAEEFVGHLNALTPCEGHRVGRVEVHPFKSADFAAVCHRMTSAEAGLDVLLNTLFAGAGIVNRRVTDVVLKSRDKRWTVYPEAVIDCSGGAVIHALGASRSAPPAAMRPDFGFSVYLTGLATETDGLLPVKVPYAIRQRVEKKSDAVPAWAAYTTFSPALTAGEGVLRLNISAAAAANAAPVKIAKRLVGWLKEDVPAFAGALIKHMSPGLLPRGGCCLKGRGLLTEQDVLTAKQPADTCVKGAWPIEFWGDGGKPDYGYLEAGTSYGISGGCLRAADSDNLFAAGRCLSADQRALASCRVAGTSLSTGEAAATDVLNYLSNG